MQVTVTFLFEDPQSLRSLDLVYQKEINYAGIIAYRYVVTSDSFNFDLPENTGYCFDNGKEFFPGHSDKCLPNGLLDISRCQRGILFERFV